MTNVDGGGSKTLQPDAHDTTVEVFCPWHPWFGLTRLDLVFASQRPQDDRRNCCENQHQRVLAPFFKNGVFRNK